MEKTNEQDICIRCSLCCNGTLFLKAKIYNDTDYRLAQSLGLNCFAENDKLFFRQPCHYSSNEGCTIYASKRPEICFRFICKLIKNYREDKINFEYSLGIVLKTNRLFAELTKEMNKFDKLRDILPKQVGKLLENFKREEPDIVSFRRKYGKVIIIHGVLFTFLKEHFIRNKKITSSIV